MPSIGFGTAGLGKQTSEAVHEALLAGYTLFDTAQVSPCRLTGLRYQDLLYLAASVHGAFIIVKQMCI